MLHIRPPQGRTPGSDRAIRREWTELADAVGVSPFAHPGWTESWAALHGAEIDLIGVRHDGILVGALPMVNTRGGLVTPTDWHTPLFEAAALDEAALFSLAEATASRRHRHLRLGFLEEGGPTHRVFTEVLEGVGYRLRQTTMLNSPFISLDGSWDDYFSQWPAKKRADLRRRRRRLEELGVVSLEVHDGNERLPDLLTEGFDVEASGWKGSNGTAIATEGTERLYRQAAAWAAATGRLRLGFLRLDGRALAFDYAFEDDGTHYLAKTGFRPDYAAYAPGKLLRAFMIEQAFAGGLGSYDFVGQDDPWKLEWTTTVRSTVTIEAFSPGVLGSIAGAADFLRRGERWMARRARRLVSRSTGESGDR